MAWAKRIACGLGMVLGVGLLFPATTVIPVQNAQCNDWNHKTFWYEPWGSSGTHKGIDIFAKQDTPVIAASSGVVLYAGQLPKGGNVAAVLGPKWRVHYYAHMASGAVSVGDWVSAGEVMGTVGQTGNAKGKPAHLHYSVLTVVLYPWLVTTETQGWKKMFYLDPVKAFERCQG
ncbi:M23 family metallopeptidase [Photobacterium japonica]|uniref:M23 family metallopeptidase n=1 Tax=Photobacterium japonica TaxID=2910235 RepID=UPI003D0A3EEF